MDAGAATRYVRKHPLPSPGDRFEELTVLGLERRESGACPVQMVRVQCSCGAAPRLVYDYNLRKGKSTRCPTCAAAAAKGTRWIKHWRKFAEAMPDQQHRTRLLARLGAAITRCRSPNNPQWRAYGGRGIRVCDEWVNDRAAFLRHVATLPGWDDPSLEMDRTNVDGNYEPGNIRFVTKKQNNQNRRTIGALQDRVRALEAECADLRSRLRRAEDALHSAVGQGALACP